MRRRELRLTSGVRRLGAASGLNPPGLSSTPSTPATILGSALVSWMEMVSGYLFVSDADPTLITNGGVPGFVVDKRDTFASQTHPKINVQGGAQALTWVSANKSVVCDGASSLAYSSGIVCSAPATFYCVGKRTSGLVWSPLGDITNDQAGLIVNAVRAITIGDDVGAQATSATLFPTGNQTMVARWRWLADGSFKFAATPRPEITLTPPSSSTITLDSVGYAPTVGFSGGTGTVGALSCEHSMWLICSEDTVVSGHDAAILSYINGLYGVTIP